MKQQARRGAIAPIPVTVTPPLETLFAAFVDTGCETSLQQLMRRGAPELRRLARRLGASAEDADDLVQETIIAAIEVADRWDRNRPLLPWLRGILTFRRAHLARAQVRRRANADPANAAAVDAVAVPGPDAAAAAQQHELTADVRDAIANLPPQYRQALRLHLLEEQSPQQIAAGLQQPRATVRVHLHRGLLQLRRALQRWSAPVLAWLLMRPGAAAMATPARRTAAIALPLLAAIACWFVGSRAADVDPGVVAPVIAAPPAARLVATDATAAEAEATALRLVAEPTASAPAVLTVLAHDAAGRAVRGVGITCTRIDGVDARLHRQMGVTEADGAVRWSLPPAGRYQLQVDRGPRLELAALPQSRTYRVVLRDLPTVRGRALHQDGTPIASASIWLGSEPGDAWRGQEVTRTAADGSFELSHVPDAACLAVRHPDWVGSEVVPWRADAEQPVQLRLGPAAGRLALQVNGSDGGAIADAVVFVGAAMDAMPLHLAEGAIARRPPPCTGRSDPAGRLALAGLPPGPQPLVVLARGFAPFVGTVDIVAQAELRRSIRLQAQPALRGRVVDAAGTPIADAFVVCRSEALGGIIDALPAADGSFCFEAAPPPPLELAAQAPGHDARVERIEAVPDAPLELRLSRARRWRGTVQPLPPTSERASLRATFPPTALQPDPIVVPVAADGTFVIAASGTAPPRLALRLPGEPLWRDLTSFTTWHEDRASVQLPGDFAASAYLQGVLRTGDGAPLTAARLFVRDQDERWAEVGSTDADGAFRLGPLPPGRYGLHAETTRADQPSWWLGEHQLAAGATSLLHPLAPAAGALQLDLGAEDGGEPGPMVVTIQDVVRGRRAALPQSPHARQVLLPGAYRVFAMGDRLAWVEGAPVQIEAGAVTTLRLRLPRANHVTLVLRGLPEAAAGGPPRTFEVHDLDRGGVCGQFSPAEHAAPRLQAVLPVGHYELRHTDGTGRDWRAPFAVDSAAAPSVQVLHLMP